MARQRKRRALYRRPPRIERHKPAPSWPGSVHPASPEWRGVLAAAVFSALAGHAVASPGLAQLMLSLHPAVGLTSVDMPLCRAFKELTKVAARMVRTSPGALAALTNARGRTLKRRLPAAAAALLTILSGKSDA